MLNTVNSQFKTYHDKYYIFNIRLYTKLFVRELSKKPWGQCVTNNPPVFKVLYNLNIAI